MTRSVHPHNGTRARPRGVRLAMVFASTALISGSVILPATAATAAASPPAAASAVTDGGNGGQGRAGPGRGSGGNTGTTGEAERCGITGRCQDWNSGGRGGAGTNGGKPASVLERYPVALGPGS